MKWEKIWQSSTGTTELSLEVNASLPWRKKEEKLEDWEEIEIPPYEEMRRFHGTEPPSPRRLQEKKDLENEARSWIAERRSQELPQRPTPQRPTSQRPTPQRPTPQRPTWSDSVQHRRNPTHTQQPALTLNDTIRSQFEGTERELIPCGHCNSYHYIDSCVYQLRQDEWLEYHANFLSSQAFSPNENEARAMQGPERRMTESGREMLKEDREWKRTRMLQRGREIPEDPSGNLLRAQWERSER